MKRILLPAGIALALVAGFTVMVGTWPGSPDRDAASADGDRRSLEGQLQRWYGTEDLTNFAARTRSDGDGAVPTDKTYCFAYGLGPKKLAMAQPDSLSTLTAFMPRGHGNSASPHENETGNSGSTTCGGDNATMGFQLDKDSITVGSDHSATGSLYGMHMIRNWDQDLDRRPWSTDFGANPVLSIDGKYAVEERDADGETVQYGQFIVSLVDTSQSNPSYSSSVWLTVSLWDSRGVHDESVHLDFGGTPNYIVDTYAAPGLEYVTLGAGSQTFDGDGACGCTWYSVGVTEENLVDAITDVNAAAEGSGGPAAVYSLQADDYAINLVGGGTEMYSPEGSTGSIGSRMGGLNVSTRY